MRDDPTGVMLFAAGFGTRMAPLTDSRPKPLIEVAGRALLDHALALTDGLPGLTRVVNSHYLAAQIADHLAGRHVTVIEESPEILDTGGGLQNALPYFGQARAVFTLNTDAVWRGPNGLELLARAWDPVKMDALLLCVPPEQAFGHKGKGDFLLSGDGRLRRGPGLTYTGLQIVKTAPVAQWPEKVFSLNKIWSQAAEADRLYGLSFPGQWCDVGHPGGIKIAEEMLSADDLCR
ncbi:MAG: nucleotidyltransferase family protein [Mangrovicoccus sp.]